MSEEKRNPNNLIGTVLSNLTADGVQKYILGTKKNGNPRAVYDIVRDYTKPKKKKKKNRNKDGENTYSLYLRTKKHKKKKKKNTWSL